MQLNLGSRSPVSNITKRWNSKPINFNEKSSEALEVPDADKEQSFINSSKLNGSIDLLNEEGNIMEKPKIAKKKGDFFKDQIFRLKNSLLFKKKATASKKIVQNSRKVYDSSSDPNFTFDPPKLLEAKDLDQENFYEKKESRKPSSVSLLTRKRNHLMIFVQIVRFITFLKLSVLSKKLNKLNNFHYKILEENIYYPEFKHSLMDRIFKKLGGFEKLIQKKLRSFKPLLLLQRGLVKCFIVFKHHIHLIEPDHVFFIYWNLFVMIFLGLNVIHVPLCLSFELIASDYLDYLWLLMDDFPNIVMILNIFIEMNSSYYLKGVYVNSRKKIFINYVKNNILLDICTLTPYFASKILTDIPDWGIIHYKIFYLLRFFYLIPKVHLISEQLSLKRSLVYLIEALKLSFSIFYMAHILCTFWHWLGRYGSRTGVIDNWLAKYLIIEENWKVKYVWSMYWSLTTMVTVGYGDIVPQTTLEKTFAICAMVLACGAFGYFLNYIGTIVQEAWRQEGELKSQIVDTLRYLKSRNVGKTLQLKIKRYVEYMNKEKKEAEISNNLFANLSKSLKVELFVDMYGGMLMNNPILRSSFSKPFLNALTSKMRELKYVPDDIICSQNETGNSELYFIIKGNVDIGVSRTERGKTDIIIKEAVKGDSFGEYAFFTGFAQDYTARAREITTLAVISQDDFLSVAENFGYDRERYYEIRDRIIQGLEFGILEKKCESCESRMHAASNCPLLSYKPSRERVIKRHINLISSKAYSYKRKSRKKFNARKNKTLSEQEAQRLLKVLENENFFSDQSSFEESDEENKEAQGEQSNDVTKETGKLHSSNTARKSAFNEKQMLNPLENTDHEELLAMNRINSPVDKRSSKAAVTFNTDKNKILNNPLIINNNSTEGYKFAPSISEARPKNIMNRKQSTFQSTNLNYDNSNFKSWGESIFDAVKIYKNYLPQNNIDRIILELKRGKNLRKTYVTHGQKSPQIKKKKLNKFNIF